MIHFEEIHMSRIGEKLLLTFTLLLGLAVAAQPQATTPGQQPAPAPGSSSAAQPSAQDQAHQSLEKIGTDLNLTADQKTKLEPILTNEIQLVQSLRADTSMTPEQKQTKFRDTLVADHDKIDAILTPEQKQKLAQLNAQHQAAQAGSSSQSGSAAPTPNSNQAPAPNPNQPPKP